MANKHRVCSEKEQNQISYICSLPAMFVSPGAPVPLTEDDSGQTHKKKKVL